MDKCAMLDVLDLFFTGNWHALRQAQLYCAAHAPQGLGFGYVQACIDFLND